MATITMMMVLRPRLEGRSECCFHGNEQQQQLQAIYADIHDGVGWLDNDALDKTFGPGEVKAL